MTTKPPAEVNLFDADADIKKLYSAIDELDEFIPVPNDRNRLSFCVNMYLNNETESVLNAIIQAQPRSTSLSFAELEKHVVKKLEEKGLSKNA